MRAYAMQRGFVFGGHLQQLLDALATMNNFFWCPWIVQKLWQPLEMILIHNPAKITWLAWILTKKLHNCSLHSLHLKLQEWKSRMVMSWSPQNLSGDRLLFIPFLCQKIRNPIETFQHNSEKWKITLSLEFRPMYFQQQQYQDIFFITSISQFFSQKFSQNQSILGGRNPWFFFLEKWQFFQSPKKKPKAPTTQVNSQNDK